MDGLKMAQQHPLSAAVMAKGLFGALSAAGAAMDPRSLAMAAAFLHQGPVNLAGLHHHHHHHHLHQQQLAAAAAAANLHHGLHHHLVQQVCFHFYLLWPTAIFCADFLIRRSRSIGLNKICFS